MYTEQELIRILRHWERLQAFRPVLKNNGVRFDCSRMVSEKPVLPWESSENKDVDYLVSIGNYSVERLMDAIYKKRDRVIPQEEAEKLTDLRSSLCLFRVDVKGKMRRDSFYIIPFMALLGFISKNTSADYSEGEKQILQKNRNFFEEYCKISSLNFEHLEKMDRDVLTSLGFLISDLKNKKNNSTTVICGRSSV